ncbi:hypothetical protein D623_10035395 [Myotis brandtii]|uniref:Uncharacterized protein n=1 Tax=Myotis brandtii TaxID=109478 RepID=S7MMJ1_MYOBR|nr:hypothetical protein D623_10035395 [Myotis brandtii]
MLLKSEYGKKSPVPSKSRQILNYIIKSNNHAIVLSARRVKHGAKDLPSHNRCNGFIPIFQAWTQRLGEGRSPRWVRRLESDGRDDRRVKARGHACPQLGAGPQPELRADGSGRTCGDSDKILGARRRPPRGLGLPGPNLQWQQESPHRTRRRGALESGDRWVSRGLPGRRGRKQRAPLNPPTPKTHRLTATPEELERNSPASTPHPKSRWPGRQSG